MVVIYPLYCREGMFISYIKCKDNIFFVTAVFVMLFPFHLVHLLLINKCFIRYYLHTNFRQKVHFLPHLLLWPRRVDRWIVFR